MGHSNPIWSYMSFGTVYEFDYCWSTPPKWLKVIGDRQRNTHYLCIYTSITHLQVSVSHYWEKKMCTSIYYADIFEKMQKIVVFALITEWRKKKHIYKRRHTEFRILSRCQPLGSHEFTYNRGLLPRNRCSNGLFLLILAKLNQ